MKNYIIVVKGIRFDVILLALGFLCLLTVPSQSQQYQQAYERAARTIEDITGKPFKETVDIRSQSREEFLTYLQKQIDASFSDGELGSISTIYSQLGLLPEDYDLEEQLLELYRSQAGAYYDPSTGSVRTLSGDLPAAQMYFMYLHELVHAHQHQHYAAMSKRHQRATMSFDAMMAFNFTIEGHANLVTMASQLGVKRLNDEYFTSKRHLEVFRLLTRFTSINLSQLDIIKQFAGSSRLMKNLKMMQNTPDVLIKQMIDPYFWGQYYWYHKASGSSWDRALDWLSEPPVQTRSIIYRSSARAGEGSNSLGDPPAGSQYSDSMGVYFLLRWLGRLEQKPSWGGSFLDDRLSVVETERDTYLVWGLTFEGDQPARRFTETLLDRGGVSGGKKNHGNTVALQRSQGIAYLKVSRTDSTVRVYVEDDPDRESY
ncbi:MAG: hypothetical protein ABEH89_01195 [bacterium]